MPNILKTKIHDINVEIENITDYPFQNEFKFKIKQSQSIPYTIKIRKPHWVTKIRTSENFRIENQFIVINRIFSDNDIIQFNFETDVLIKADTNGRHYFSYGVLIYALPIKSVEIIGKNYGNNFTDYTYKPISNIIYTFQNGIESKFNNNKIETQLINPKTNTLEHVELIPFGKTILRQVTF
ncbi:MAG: glycoside hydrolase family 127 protein [Alphaproteobacteria bacterium]|nr:glycoside hydrolase family 127 protein [Alphaproteobacteria bacterium]